MYKEVLALLFVCVLRALSIPSSSIWSLKYLFKLYESHVSCLPSVTAFIGYIATFFFQVRRPRYVEYRLQYNIKYK